MKNREFADKLTIDNGRQSLNLDILSADLDRSYSAFELESKSSRNIDGYSIMVNTDNLEKDALRNLEEIVNAVNQMFNVTLNLNGEQKQGKAKISENLCLSGICLDLELHD